MGLIITPVNEYTDAGELQGILQDIACGCWFTQNGKTIPKLICAMDERGGICKTGVYKRDVYMEDGVSVVLFIKSGHPRKEYNMRCLPTGSLESGINH